MDREVLEAQRYPAPPHPLERRRASRWIGLAHRADAPGAVARCCPPVGRDVDGLAVDAQLAGPGADLGETARVEQHLVALTPEVLRLLDGRVVRLEAEVEAEPVVVAVA